MSWLDSWLLEYSNPSPTSFYWDTFSLILLPWLFRWYRICLQCRGSRFSPWAGKIPWRWEWLPTPVFLPGEFHGQRSPVGYSPWGCKELDITKRLTLSLLVKIYSVIQLELKCFRIFLLIIGSESIEFHFKLISF